MPGSTGRNDSASQALPCRDSLRSASSSSVASPIAWGLEEIMKLGRILLIALTFGLLGTSFAKADMMHHRHHHPAVMIHRHHHPHPLMHRDHHPHP
jgi:hypothetical protein